MVRRWSRSVSNFYALIGQNVTAIFNSTVETSLLELLGVSRVLRNEKVNAISTLASRQELLAVLTPLLPQAKMLLVPIADVEPSIEGDLAARELTRMDFDFLHAGLALSNGTFKGRLEAYNQDLVMWMCFEGEVQFP
ncbi:unnamed protein product [Porites lobata]|uniref:Uncharacterized protein n=1 Tax=Porites lobata TaxID=104759 RepID=A0ABN8QS59_9CNID|nr:unnamed protein product [Porites lobata]